MISSKIYLEKQFPEFKTHRICLVDIFGMWLVQSLPRRNIEQS